MNTARRPLTLVAATLCAASMVGCSSGTSAGPGPSIRSTDPTSTSAAVSGSPTVADVPTAAAPAPVVFQDAGRIRVLTPGAGARTVAADAPDGQEHPDWSPDGRRLVFDTGFSALWVVDGDGSHLTRAFQCAAPCHSVQDAAWSPDGRALAFAVAESTDGRTTSRSAILALDLATRRITTLHEDRSHVVWLFAPRWAPDSGSVVFEEDTYASDSLSEERVTRTRIAVARLADGPRVARYAATADQGQTVSTPDWSPLGDRIAYVLSDNLVLARPDGTVRTVLTAFDGTTTHARQPTFTPDGSAVVFTYVRGEMGVDDRPTAAIVRTDGTGFTTVGEGLRITHPRLRPSA